MAAMLVLDDPWVRAYEPVLRLMWETPLSEPLLRWADLWGVRNVSEAQAWAAADYPGLLDLPQ